MPNANVLNHDICYMVYGLHVSSSSSNSICPAVASSGVLLLTAISQQHATDMMALRLYRRGVTIWVSCR